MGDRVQVQFTFGGKVSRTVADEFLTLLLDEGTYSQETGRKVKLDDLLEGNEVYIEEVNYAQTDEIDSFCETHKIDFDKWHESGGGYPGACIRMRDGVLSDLPAVEGEPMIPLARLLEIETLATGMANLLELAKTWRAGSLPDFEIVEGVVNGSGEQIPTAD